MNNFNIYYKLSCKGQKKTFSTRIDDELLKTLKHLAVDTDRALGELLEEAIRELVRKYAKPKK